MTQPQKPSNSQQRNQPRHPKANARGPQRGGGGGGGGSLLVLLISTAKRDGETRGKWVEEGGSEGRDGERGNEGEGEKRERGREAKEGKVWEDEVRGGEEKRNCLSLPPPFPPLPPPLP